MHVSVLAIEKVKVEPFLQQAIAARFGIIVRAVSGSRLKQALYRARADARAKGNSLYDTLKFITSPRSPETEVWIIKESADGAPPETD